MKKAKRILSLLMAVIMSVSMLAMPASAAPTAEQETKAKVLFALGLFKGYDNTGTNFGLADGVSREQAILLLIRMLGEEKAAEVWQGAQPYNDVLYGNYFYPYIGYAKAKGYTNGIGDNKFGLTQSANMTQMAAFALRGLGYSETAGDFLYPNSVSFAAKLGILESATTPAVFTRGHAVDIIDGAVATNVKNQKFSLLDKLANNGAITQAQIEKAAAIANGTNQGKSDIAAGTYNLKCMGNNLRIVSDKLVLKSTTPAQAFKITNKNGYSYIQTADGDYVGVTNVNKGTQPVLGTTPYSWLIQKISTGVYTIRPAEKPEMLACAGEASSKDGTQMLLWPHADNAKHGLVTFTAPGANVPVTSVSLDQTTVKLAVGKSAQLSGTIYPNNATNQDVTWTSSSSSIARVNGEGLVTAIKAGTATITVKTEDGKKTAACKVTVSAPVNYIDKTVNLYNSTNKAAKAIHISSAQNRDWGSNLISGNLQPNAKVSIIVPVASNDYTYDIEITYADDSTATFSGYNFKNFTTGATLYAYISNGSPILSTTKPASAYTDKTVNLFNSTNKAAKSVLISSTQTRDWGSNLLSTNLQPNAKVSIIVPVSSSDYTYDIEITYADNTTATFSGYNFKNFTSGGSLYAYISNGSPILSTTKPASAYTDKTVNLFNSTNKVAKSVLISSAQTRDWGSNLLSANLQPNAKVSIIVPVSSSDYTYDIEITYADDSTATFSGYNFKNFTTGATLYAYISNGSPILSTTKPTVDASAELKARYESSIVKYNTLIAKCKRANLDKDPTFVTSMNAVADEVNKMATAISEATGALTDAQIKEFTATLNDLDTFIVQMEQLIKGA